MIGFVKTSVSNGVVGIAYAGMIVAIPKTSITIPSFGPKTTAATITVIWMIVKLIKPSGMNLTTVPLF